MLHPDTGKITIEQLEKRINALESSDNRYAQRGGSAITYDSTGRIQYINATYINAGTIDASVVTVSNINASNISTGTLSANRIGAGSITGSKIASDTIEAGNIAAGAITASEIATNAVTADKINAGAVTATKISVSDLSAISAAFTNTTTGNIQSNQGFFGGSLVSGGSPRSSSYDLDIDDDAWIGDRLYVGGSSEYFQGSGAGNDLKAYFDDNFEFYKGGTIKGIVDDNIWTAGDLLANGSKPFLIKHPDGSNRYLRYTAQESPDVSLRVRGRSKLDATGNLTIMLPDHFFRVTDATGLVTVNITPIGNSRLFVKDVTTAVLMVGGDKNAEFFYEVVAIRDGYKDRPVELDPNDETLPESDLTLITKLGMNEEKSRLSKEDQILAEAKQAEKRIRNAAVLGIKLEEDTLDKSVL